MDLIKHAEMFIRRPNHVGKQAMCLTLQAKLLCISSSIFVLDLEILVAHEF